MIRLINSELKKTFLSPLSLITLAVLIGFYAFTAFDICVNRIAPYELHPRHPLGSHSRRPKASP